MVVVKTQFADWFKEHNITIIDASDIECVILPDQTALSVEENNTSSDIFQDVSEAFLVQKVGD